jgi:hypothetical protein
MDDTLHHQADGPAVIGMIAPLDAHQVLKGYHDYFLSFIWFQKKLDAYSNEHVAVNTPTALLTLLRGIKVWPGPCNNNQ